MATKKSSVSRSAPAAATTEEPSKAELQRRMAEARQEISQTVEEIKDTVTEQYEAVKDTVTETLDWREQFRKHSVAWSLGALAVGYVVGTSLAASLEGPTTTKKKGRSSGGGGFVDEIYAIGEKLSEEFSDVAETILLPALGKKIKDKFGVDVSDRLRGLIPAKRTTSSSASKGSAKKGGAKKGGAKKGTAKKASAKKSAPGKGAARKS